MSHKTRTEKLNSIALCLNRLEQKKPSELKQLKSDIDLQDIIMINLERVVQLSVDVSLILISDQNLAPMPQTMADSFETLFTNKIIDETLKERMQKAVGFRSLCVHEYEKINWEIVYKILNEHLDDFKSSLGSSTKSKTKKARIAICDPGFY